jgi:NADP-dependent 3-hydroxy acid dehydrogenase YdfG
MAAIDVLINNAGLALGRDYFEEADLHAAGQCYLF